MLHLFYLLAKYTKKACKPLNMLNICECYHNLDRVETEVGALRVSFQDLQAATENSFLRSKVNIASSTDDALYSGFQKKAPVC